jgi:hypothetical protein
LLIAVPKKKIMMKLLVAVVWLLAFCAALAFGSAFLALYVPVYSRFSEKIFINFKAYLAGRMQNFNQRISQRSQRHKIISL